MQHIIFDVVQIVLAAIKNLHRVVARVQMLQNLGNNLSLGAGILLAHRSIDELDNVLVEVRDEMIQILVVCLSVQALASDPLDCVPFNWSNWFVESPISKDKPHFYNALTFEYS